MEQLLKIFPSSFINLIGLLVVAFLLKIAWTFAEKWGEQFYRAIRGNKEKRRDNSVDYSGIERRSERSSHLDKAVSDLIDAWTEQQKEFTAYIAMQKDFQQKMADSIEQIKRQQKNNWDQLFNEEIPMLKHAK